VYDMSWWSVNHALVVKAAGMTASAPAGVRMLGVDETRARSVRWLLAKHGRRRTDPWMTSFVDLDPTTLGASSGWRLAGPVPASAGDELDQQGLSWMTRAESGRRGWGRGSLRRVPPDEQPGRVPPGDQQIPAATGPTTRREVETLPDGRRITYYTQSSARDRAGPR